jgi:hypothetical protein
MAKNYADLYVSTNDSSALEQRFYIKQETTKGDIIAPQNGDFFYTLAGGSIEFSQPFESSPHRSGRHHLDIIKQKKTLSWSLTTFLNIDESLGAASTAEIDQPVRTLFKSLLGKEVTSPNLIYTAATAPDITFSIMEVGDKWARQARGCFVNSGTMTFPGDGQAQVEWSGNGVESILVGLGKSTINNDGGNTITLQSGEGKKFPVGSLVMIVEANGTTRSADTPAGTARKVTSVTGDVVTVNGTALADADGISTPIYLCYYEPAAPAAINNPVTGLVGSISVVGLTMPCFRSATVAMTNDHELVDYCYGEDALAGAIFVPGNRFTATVTVEMNLNDEMVKFFNEIQEFDAKDITVVLGNSAGRHLEVAMPNVKFNVPAFAIPETGSIPVSFEGNAFQTALDAADEVTVEFK